MEPPGPSSTHVPFGRYLLKERLAQGGMGEVFRAVAVGEAGFEKPVVVKRILPAHAGRSDFLDLFVAEAKLMTRLAHPNIVEVLDFGRGEGGEAFLVLELVHGLDLGRLARAFAARTEPFPLPLALFIASQVLRGLHHAHTRSGSSAGWLVHRDISPGNVLLSSEGEVKVADFGVALITQPGAEASPTSLVGKPPYMAPEQFDGKDLDPRADLFSVGVVLFELCTGQLPFAGGTFTEQQERAHRGDFPAAAALRADVPSAVDALIRRALAPRRDDRFPDAKAMAQAIEGLRDEGVRLATSDDVADAVRAAMREAPAAGRRVIALRAAAPEPEEETPPRPAPEQELTRTFGAGGVGAFTLRVTVRDLPAEPPRTMRIEEPPPPDPGTQAPLTSTPAIRADSDPPSIPLTQPVVSRRAIGLAVGGLIVLLAVGVNLRRHTGRRHDAPLPSAELPAPTLPPLEPPPPRVEPSPLVTATTPPLNTPPPHHTPTARASAQPAPSATATAAPTEGCEGIVRIASLGSFTVSGGPQTVQSPGLYTWRCGTFALTAVSRADPALVKHKQVTIHAGATTLVDLR